MLTNIRGPRHGARLDVENKEWHLTATEPYNTPLTFGGWIQTRTLGARIASILHARDVGEGSDNPILSPHSLHPRTSSEPISREKQSPPKRRKRRIILHSSPYLRCVQSSIAISAGISQYEGNIALAERQESRPPSRSRSQRLYTPNRAKTLDTSALEARYRDRGSSPTASKTFATSSATLPPTPVLRIDAFLGEWQSPDYYQNMTHPPASNMIVAGTKAELIRSAEPINGSSLHESFPSRPSTSSEGDRTGSQGPNTSSFSLDSVAKHLPRAHTYASSATNDVDDRSSSPLARSVSRRETQTSVGYVPPQPNYAISTSESIPDGYVAHARDACINFDYQWDSMREPQNWPDGGVYGEEWSAMHNRFRKGFRDMVGWYTTNGPRGVLELSNEEVDDPEEELVVVLVTHSAGCNALIGALTNQPVLMDIAMASLTMATLKEQNSPRRLNSVSPERRRGSVVDCAPANEYEMKLVNSTEHLRGGPDPLKIPQLQTPPLGPTRAEVRRNRGISLSAMQTIEVATDLDRPRSKNSALGSMRRVRATLSPSASIFPGFQQDVSSPTESGGLWDPRRSSVQSAQSIQEEEALDPLTPEHTISPEPMSPRPRRNTGSTERSEKSEKGNQSENDVVPELTSPSVATFYERRASQQQSKGLWGGPKEVKRRWTVSEK